MRKKNLEIVKIFTLILGIVMVLYLFGNEIEIVSGEDEIFYMRGETDFPPQEGSCFWGGRLVNGMFYFYIYKEGSWQFSNDVRGTWMCPIKIWPEPAQKTFSDVWLDSYIGAPEHRDKVIQEDFITREKLCRCYDDLIDEEIKNTVLELTEITDIGEIFGLGKGYLIGQGIEYYNINHYGEFYDIFNKPEKIEKGIGITFVKKGAFLNLGEDKFTNIEPQKSPKHPPYIFLDEVGEIIRADFTVNSNGGEYTFEGETISAPPNSRIFFDKRTIVSAHIPSGIDIQVPDGIDLTEFSSLFDISEHSLTIRGNDITLPNGLVLKNNDEEEGELIIYRKNGFLFTKGMVDYKGRRFDASKQTGDILFAEFGTDLSGYEGNKVIETRKGFEMHSAKNGRVSMRVLPGNELFNTNENDYLQLEVSSGDSLEVVEGTIPTIKHNSSEKGRVTIRNGKHTIDSYSSKAWYEPVIKTSESSLLKSLKTVNLRVMFEGGYELVFDDKDSFSYGLPDEERVSLTHMFY